MVVRSTPTGTRPHKNPCGHPGGVPETGAAVPQAGNLLLHASRTVRWIMRSTMKALEIISWNIAHRPDAWRGLLDGSTDVALLQEACAPPGDLASRLNVDPEPWTTAGAECTRRWRTAIVGLSPDVTLMRYAPRPLSDALPGELPVSRLGTLAAAEITHPSLHQPITLISMYGLWETAHASTGSSWIYADASVHRVISDLSVFVGSRQGHRIIAAGDLNILFGHGEHGETYWADRYATIFSRFETLGLKFVGPQFPDGRQADPWPAELPRDSKNVATYFTSRQKPSGAERQLDFVFASTALAPQITATALNSVETWGPSDHCRVRISVAPNA